MTSTTNLVYSSTNTANGNVVKAYFITRDTTYKIPIYEVAIPVIAILVLLTVGVWLFIRKRKKNSN